MVPVRRRKVEVEYYPSEGEEDDMMLSENLNYDQSGDGRKTATMYDLMVRGQKLKTFSRQDEERRRIIL